MAVDILAEAALRVAAVLVAEGLQVAATVAAAAGNYVGRIVVYSHFVVLEVPFYAGSKRYFENFLITSCFSRRALLHLLNS